MNWILRMKRKALETMKNKDFPKVGYRLLFCLKMYRYRNKFLLTYYRYSLMTNRWRRVSRLCVFFKRFRVSRYRVFFNKKIRVISLSRHRVSRQ